MFINFITLQLYNPFSIAQHPVAYHFTCTFGTDSCCTVFSSHLPFNHLFGSHISRHLCLGVAQCSCAKLLSAVMG